MRIIVDPEDVQQEHAPLGDVYLGHSHAYYDVPARLHRVLEELKRAYPSHIQAYRDFGRKPLLRVHSAQFLTFLERAYVEWEEAGGNPVTGVQSDTFYSWRVPQESWWDFIRRWLYDRTLGLYSGDAHVTAQPKRGNPGLMSEGGAPGYFSSDFGAAPLLRGTWKAAYVAAQIALTATQELMDHQGKGGVFALCRPPGYLPAALAHHIHGLTRLDRHHAHSELVGGFCFLNNAAIAAQYLIDHYRKNVVILDVDYHHGNGTQEIFYAKANPKYVSLHGMHDYPWFTGYREERGTGHGLYFNANYPLALKTSEKEWLDTLALALKLEVETRVPTLPAALVHLLRYVIALPQRPDVLVVSLGVDTFEEDPVGSFQLSVPAYRTMGNMLGALQLPTLFVMEGGYNVEKVGVLVAQVLQGFEEAQHQ